MADSIPDVSYRIATPLPGVRSRAEGDGLVLLRRRFGPLRSAVGKAFGVPPDFTLRLDRLSAEAWLLLDGTRSVGEVNALLRARHPGVEDMAARLGRLVGLLVSKRFLVLR